mmetsp:Transcript_62108/g.74730  ORF Transcript_62108/g.74730 Transcript_62108/m.74730 type:complete len:333 (+) Transcript_62108:213-1211(+)
MMSRNRIPVAVAAIGLFVSTSIHALVCTGFAIHPVTRRSSSIRHMSAGNVEDPIEDAQASASPPLSPPFSIDPIDAIPTIDEILTFDVDPIIREWKDELKALAAETNRGFDATKSQQTRAKDLVSKLQSRNPTPEPASSYYATPPTTDYSTIGTSTTPTVAGKWTLIYTNAPDITGLDTSKNPFSTAKLGRIGQECSPPFIKNVIEWKRPDWAKNLPFAGSDDTRILQKVVTKGLATPEEPLLVDLSVAGFELASGNGSIDTGLNLDIVQEEGWPASLLALNPIDSKVNESWNTIPFGQFKVLFLDEELRIIETSQKFLAVNQRIAEGEGWF